MPSINLSTKEEYLSALKEVSPMFDDQPELGTDRYQRLMLLVDAIEVYERIHYPITPPDKIE